MPTFVNNLQEKMKLNNKLLEEILPQVVETALKQENYPEEPEVSIALVDDNYIQALNLKFRQKDLPTDVLSFPMAESTDEEPEVDWEEDNILGDIIISVERAQSQALEYGHSLNREMAYLTAHGMFHLLGYDHENEAERQIMREKEEKVLTALDIVRD